MGNNQVSKTNKGVAFSYAMGSVGTNISWYIINNYLTLFYTDIVTLSAAAISMIMLIARVWDAINDPMMGLIVDRTKSRWGKFRPYLMFAPPFLAVFNILTFTVFPVTGTAKVILCLVLYIGAGMSYTAVQVPYTSLLNRLSKDSQARMDYVTASQVGGSIIQVVLSLVIMPMILFFSGSDAANAKGFFISVIICNLVMIPFVWICARNCKEVIVDDVPKTAASKRPIKESLKDVVRNKYMMMLLFSLLVGCIAVIGRMSVLSYYVIYVMGSYTLISVMFTTLTLTQLIGNFFLPLATRKLGKVKWFLIMMLAWSIGCIVLFFVPATNTVMIMVLTAVIGFTASSASISFGMMADCIVYGDYTYGVRDEGFVSSFQSLAVKFGQAIVGVVAIPLLFAAGYTPGVEQTQSAATMINLIVNVVPGVLNIIAIIPMFWYKLDEKKVGEMTQKIEERKKA